MQIEKSKISLNVTDSVCNGVEAGGGRGVIGATKDPGYAYETPIPLHSRAIKEL